MSTGKSLQLMGPIVPGRDLTAYIASVSSIAVLTPEQERDLANQYYYENNVDAARQLVLSHLRVVVAIARGYKGYGLPQADLIQEGNIGLMKAVKRFDPDVGVRLVSFAVHWIRAEMHEYIIRNWRIVKVATTKAQRKLFFNLRRSKKRLGWLNAAEDLSGSDGRGDAWRDEGITTVLSTLGTGLVTGDAVNEEVANLEVVATASRPESARWVRDLGAHHVIDPRADWREQLGEFDVHSVDYVASLTASGEHVAKSADILSPHGAFCLIDDPAQFDVGVFKRKSIAIHWELMFTRSLYDTPDMHEQGRLLQRVAQLVDQGVLKSTVNGPVRDLDANTLEAAHRELRAGTSIGKRVLRVSLG